MVWPEINFIDWDGGQIPLPRARKYEHFLRKYEATLQTYDNKNIPLRKVSNIIYDLFDDVEILFSSKKKIKISSLNRDSINNMVSSKQLIEKYRIFIPMELCEIRAVIDVPDDPEFTEEYIYKNMEIKNYAEYGPFPNSVKITEVKRLSKPDPNHAGKRVNMDLVSVSFTGNRLPSHVILDRIIFPVKTFTQPIIQCRKCWHFGHSNKICRRNKFLCSQCGSAHIGECNSHPKCINCGEDHDAKSFSCPVRLELRKRAKQEADEKAPKKINNTPIVYKHNTENVFTFIQEDFPEICNKRAKLAVNKTRKRNKSVTKLPDPTNLTIIPENQSIPENKPTISVTMQPLHTTHSNTSQESDSNNIIIPNALSAINNSNTICDENINHRLSTTNTSEHQQTAYITKSIEESEHLNTQFNSTGFCQDDEMILNSTFTNQYHNENNTD